MLMFSRSVAVVVFGIIVGCGSEAGLQTPERELEKPRAAKPISRAGDPGAELWFARHEELTSRLAQGPVNLLFVGDSITHFWEPSEYWADDGHNVWEEYYGRRNAVNFGIGGDLTEHLLWRLLNSELHLISPRVVVIEIGTNNEPFDSAENIAKGIIEVVETLRNELPNSKILLLAIFPRGESPDNPKRKKLDRANRLCSGVADGEMVFYLDLGSAFLQSDGTLKKELFPDFLHPGARGYAKWAEAMEPTLSKMFAEN
jgi:beta-glucosidase